MRPALFRTSSRRAASETSWTDLPDILPSLVVFDLDHTLWTPELYQLRGLTGYADASGPGPVAGKDVRLIADAGAILDDLASNPRWSNTRFAVASRTNKGPWARKLLGQFTATIMAGNADPGVDTVKLNELLPYQQIYPGSKIQHFEALRQETGISYEDMLFFDDAKGGKFGNCEPVSQLGVMAAHCPDGLTTKVWSNALSTFARAKATGGRVGIVVDDVSSDDNVADESTHLATVVKFFPDKRFGFCRLQGSRGRSSGGNKKEGKQQDIFFHVSALAAGCEASSSSSLVGSSVRVKVGRDERSGRLACSQVVSAAAPASSSSSSSSSSSLPPTSSTPPPPPPPLASSAPTVSLPCFSMNLPFAALVAHGVKTLETRNHTMLAGYQGCRVLLHVGQRTYPDGGKHREILMRARAESGVSAAAALSEAEVERATALPRGFAKGAVVAVLELGETVLVESARERSSPDMERGAVATGQAMGRYLTPVTKAAWLKPPGLPMKGFPGVATVDLPANLLPSSAKGASEEPSSSEAAAKAPTATPDAALSSWEEAVVAMGGGVFRE